METGACMPSSARRCLLNSTDGTAAFALSILMHCRYHTDARQKRALRIQAFEAWESVTCAPILERLAASVSFSHVLRVRPHGGQQVDNAVSGGRGLKTQRFARLDDRACHRLDL